MDVFSIHFTNISGLATSLTEVHQYLQTNLPDILFLTETQVSKNRLLKRDLYCSGYVLESSFFKKHGVCAFIKSDEVSYARLKEYEYNTTYANTMVLKIHFSLNQRSVIVICLYRSPNSPTNDECFENLTYILDDLRTKYDSEICVLGDFNIHNRSWLTYSNDSDHLVGKQAELFAASHSLTQLVKEPTHIARRRGEKEYLIDLYLTTMEYCTEVRVLQDNLGSDHRLITASIRVERNVHSKALPRKVYSFSRGDYAGLRQYYRQNILKKVTVFNPDINVLATELADTIKSGMDKYIPNQIINPKDRKIYTFKSAKARKAKKQAFTRYNTIRSSNIPDPNAIEVARRNYVEMRNVCTAVLNSERESFDKKKADKFVGCSTSSREFWKLAAHLRSNFTNSSFPSLIKDAVPISNSKEKADIFASMFASNSTIDPPSINVPHLERSVHKMKPLFFKIKKIRNILQNLDLNKSCGPDGIPARILKLFARELAPALSKIFNLSYQQGVCPDCWKIANVHPIEKRGNRSDPSNYRPVALISIVAKVFEQYLNDALVSFLEKTNLINDRQYGFRRKRSTGDMLAFVTHMWNRTLDVRGECYIVALDIAKAFDRVWHKNLINKLSVVGIDPKGVKWVESFLYNRVIQVGVDGVFSDEFAINAGVPQGSALSPTLFLIYINDLLNSTFFPVHSFADDSTLHASHSANTRRTSQQLLNDRANISSILNEDLEKIKLWGEKNLVVFNASKTKLCEISRLRSANDNPIIFNNVPIEKTEQVRLLGVNISKGLLWNDHIMELGMNAQKKLGYLSRCKKFLNANQLLSIYKSFIRPCLEYCSHVWGGASVTSLSLLDSVQNRAIRLINNLQLTSQLESLQHRRNVADLCIFYKYFMKNGSEEANSIIPPLKIFPRATRQQSQAHQFVVEIVKCNTTHFQWDFVNRTSIMWNNLPSWIFPVTSKLQTFKVNVHRYLSSNLI